MYIEYVYTRIHIHIHEYIYTYTNTYTHTCLPKKTGKSGYRKERANAFQKSPAQSVSNKFSTSWLLRVSTCGVKQVDIEEGEERNGKAALRNE